MFSILRVFTFASTACNICLLHATLQHTCFLCATRLPHVTCVFSALYLFAACNVCVCAACCPLVVAEVGCGWSGQFHSFTRRIRCVWNDIRKNADERKWEFEKKNQRERNPQSHGIQSVVRFFNWKNMAFKAWSDILIGKTWLRMHGFEFESMVYCEVKMAWIWVHGQRPCC